METTNSPGLSLAEIGEDEFVRRITESLPVDLDRVITGSGDDCAVLKTDNPDILELQKTDCVVEGIHFTPGTDPESVGWKAMARAVSDIAAMGAEARPVSALVTIAVSGNRSLSEIEGWYRGMSRCADKFRFSIVGGETTALPDSSPALISVAMTGDIPANKVIYRSGANIGDKIAVSGKLGGSFESGRHLNFEPRIGFVVSTQPTAMMDLSDGLAKDLPRLVKASGDLGYRIDFDTVPIHEDSELKGALTDGEDYELLFTLPPDPPDDSGVLVIGEITESVETPLDGGWDHFAENQGLASACR